MCLLNFHPQWTELGVSGTCSIHYLHRVIWQLVLYMHSPSSLCGVEADRNQSHPSWQDNRSYMGPLTPVDLPSFWERFQFWSKSWESSIISLSLVENVKLLIFPWPYKMLNDTSCEYMDSERHAYPNTSGGQQLCKVNKSHPSFSSKLFELIPKCGVTHSPTRKAMALSLLNSPHCFKIHDHVILMVKPSTPKASLSVVIALTGVPSFAFLSNQSAADMAEDNDPS